MAKEKNYTRFDWTMKRLLRQKADFVVINGFLSSLLGEKMEIIKVLESEGNKNTESGKLNRVDILVEDSHGVKSIIEIQNSSEISYFHRLLYGASKVITEYIREGENYKEIAKVYSISIVYFMLGKGKDYVYRGTAEFRGIHKNDVLQYYQSDTGTLPQYAKIRDGFPEYYILRLENFDKAATTPLDEWVHYLKTFEIPETFTAPGLPEARGKIAFDSLTPEEKKDYLRYMDSRHYAENAMYAARLEGFEKGFNIGLEEVRAKRNTEIVLNLHAMNMTIDQIHQVTTQPIDKIKEIINSHSTHV
jgi:hypothetical protein